MTATLAAQPEYASAVVMNGTLPASPGDAARALVRDAWNLPALESAYTAFLARFQPLSERLDQFTELSPADAFYVRSFLIHEYRKVLLRDPALPPELLPADWPGRAAYELTRALYRAVVWPAELFVDHAFQTESGPLPSPDKSFRLRFGEL